MKIITLKSKKVKFSDRYKSLIKRAYPFVCNRDEISTLFENIDRYISSGLGSENEIIKALQKRAFFMGGR